MKVHDKLILKNIIIFRASYWKGNAFRNSMYVYMEQGCGSNSHLTDGSDKLLCLLKKRFFEGRAPVASPHTHIHTHTHTHTHTLDAYCPARGPQNCRFKEQVQAVTTVSFTFLYPGSLQTLLRNTSMSSTAL